MAFSSGENVVAESESTERAARRGVIEEVVRGDPHPRYRIRWEDGHESIYTPADGALKRADSASGSPSPRPARPRASRAGTNRKR